MTPTRFIFPSPGFDFYWKKGHGRKMLRKLDQVPSLGEIEKRIPLLFESDILADKVIQDLHLKIGFRESHVLLENIFSQGIENVKEAPESVQKLFTQINSFPKWLDKEKMERGAVFCRRTGMMGLIVLRNYCLMGGYESSAINKPLVFTEALKKGAAKRMAETIEFWVNATGKNALERNEIGFKYALQVRLMHAYARISILKQPDWKNEEWGIPINQWDMVATNLGFSLAFMDGLRHLGFRPTEEEIEGLLHLWKYIGFLLGIPAEYLPNTEKEAIKELYCWTITQPPADNDTKALADALMNEPLLSSYPKKEWQKKILIKIHLGYNRYFLGDRSCKTMDLPYTGLKYYPYMVKCIKSAHEFFVLSNKGFYHSSENIGRKNQEKLKKMFLRGHQSNLNKH